MSADSSDGASAPHLRSRSSSCEENRPRSSHSHARERRPGSHAPRVRGEDCSDFDCIEHTGDISSVGQHSLVHPSYITLAPLGAFGRWRRGRVHFGTELVT